MKKWIVAIALSVTILSACSTDTASESTVNMDNVSESTTAVLESTAAPAPLDLNGIWSSDSSENMYQEAVISDGSIEINWVYPDSKALYWIGTYEIPDSSVTEYTWESERNDEEIGDALFASQADTKTFSYKDGIISYEVSALGETKYIKLERVESLADSTYGSLDSEKNEATAEPEELNVIDSGWCSYQSSSYIHVPYAVQIENLNADFAVEYPAITITARSADGKILKTEERVLMAIAAGDTIYYGDEITYEGSEEPEEVEISVSNEDYNFAVQDDSLYAKQDAFDIFNISENVGSHKKTFTGEITNNSEISFDSVAIIIIYKNEGQLVGGDIEYIDDLAAGSTKPFELSADSGMEQYDTYDFYAIQW